jgi:hypothetical protein
MQKITINPSIAVELDIDSIAHSEKVEINFSADVNWTGTYEVTIYNSQAKNTEVKPTGAIKMVDKVMTWTIEPKTQGIEPEPKYYEIVETQSKRLVFKGKLVITK